MGQFMGWQSYDLITICGHCGEEGPREDMRDHHLYCTNPEGDAFDEEEFVEQSEKTIKEMSDEG